jgi:dTDP-4-dehydrorhamnose reductase
VALVVCLLFISTCLHDSHLPSYSGIWHWSGQERLTDFAIAQQAAPLLGIDVSTIKAQREHPSLQPLHAELDVGMLKVMGVVRTTPFAEALQVCPL